MAAVAAVRPFEGEDRHVALAGRLRAVRAATLALLEGLTPEDCMMQSMAEASPVKWHVGHVSWFFETFLLETGEPGFRPFHPRFRELFNSYYVGVGARQPRGWRGLLSRPALQEVLDYQHAVQQRLLALLGRGGLPAQALDLIELGINHEQQHQELIVTDLKHHFWHNPLRPAWRGSPAAPAENAAPAGFVAFDGGLCEIGHAGPSFAFDNERPRHRVWIAPFELAARPVSNAEFLAFIDDGGYRRPELWLSDGWDERCRQGWEAPLYWWRDDGPWHSYTVAGDAPLDPAAPVCHVSHYEADAYARWAGARLPTEAEWEVAAAATAPGPADDFAEGGGFHPRRPGAGRLAGLWGGVWEWTQSAYLPYPGFEVAPGAVGEYNGKFMINQMVLRGGSCATPRSHIRASYRNFFGPAARWQFSGLRLARK
ncbi:ergothioneine biosynthesis protein EgtB [Pigmentiphaga soli]|uniref:Ergothioneine biosynthesis protein EgtB n=1 Tax=Pigmentiphaga soli TaxID=1007095 RepID=A0ABP8GPQ0_9BURK